MCGIHDPISWNPFNGSMVCSLRQEHFKVAMRRTCRRIAEPLWNVGMGWIFPTPGTTPIAKRHHPLKSPTAEGQGPPGYVCVFFWGAFLGSSKGKPKGSHTFLRELILLRDVCEQCQGCEFGSCGRELRLRLLCRCPPPSCFSGVSANEPPRVIYDPAWNSGILKWNSL